jgi:hypothetical protein
MPDLTPAAELRAAAARLRYLLHSDGMPEPVQQARWQLDPERMGSITAVGETRPIAQAFWGGVGDYMIAMQPAVGAALADWLDDAARSCDATVIAAKHVWPLGSDESEAFIREQTPTHALAVARSLNTPTEEQP